MCTRILNNINKHHVTVGRNMDWEFPFSPTICFTPATGQRFGMSKEETQQVDKSMNESDVARWDIQNASISTLIGDENEGYGFCDGMNQHGLVANALYDTNCSFGDNQTEQQKGLSILRLGQYILDNFANVEQAVESLSEQKLYLYGGMVPGDKFSKATLHIAISDKQGKSAILEVIDSQLRIYADDSYTVMTNQPDYATQLKMMDYWLYQWNKPDVFNGEDEGTVMTPPRNPHPVFTAPGGYTSAQRFERACFYRYMYNPEATNIDAVAQVRSMVATCNVPAAFEELYPHSIKEKLEKALGYSINSYTLWSNISDSTHGRYYLMSNLSVQSLWFDLDFSFDTNSCYTLTVDEELEKSGLMGLANQAMTAQAAPPFSHF